MVKAFEIVLGYLVGPLVSSQGPQEQEAASDSVSE